METGKALPCPSPMIKAGDSPRTRSSPRPHHPLPCTASSSFLLASRQHLAARGRPLPLATTEQKGADGCPLGLAACHGAKTPRLRTASDPRYLLAVARVTHTSAAITPSMPAHTSSELFKVTGRWIGAQRTQGICFTQPLAPRAPLPLACTRQQRRNATRRGVAVKGGVHVYLCRETTAKHTIKQPPCPPPPQPRWSVRL